MNPRNARIAIAAAIVVLIAMVIGAFAQTYGGDDGATVAAPLEPCPERFIESIGQAARIRERLASFPEGRALLDDLHVEVRFCFGEIDVPVVSEDRLLLMDRRADLAEQTARAGHLLHHVVAGLPFPDEVAADADCEAIVDAAVEREAGAYLVEVRLRRAQNQTAARYEFEPDLWAAAEPEREALVARYLREHPGGAPHIDGLVAGYRQRCEVERSEAGR